MPCGQCMARASSRSILHVPHISKIPRRIRYDFKYFVKVIWKLIIGGAGLGGGILMKLGDKDISSTSGVRIGLVENANIHKHLHISDGICIFQIQMISSDIWEDLPSSEFAYGARSIPEMISVIK